MKKIFQKLFGESLVYGLSAIISSFISIFLIPLYTKVFDPADYGIISLLLTTFAVLNIFIIFSLDYSVAVWYWDKTDDVERKKTFSSWVWFLIPAGLVICVLLFLLSKPLSYLYFGNTDQYGLFILLGLNLAFSGFQKAANIWFRMLQKPFHAMFYSIFLMLVTVGCNVLFVLQLKVGIKGVFYSQGIGSVAGFILLPILFRRWINFRSFDKQRLKEMLKFAAPMVPATLMFWLMNTASVFFIKYYIKDNAEIGLFQIGANVANVLGLATWAFFQAWPAFAMSLSKQENAQKIYSIIFEVYCVLGAFIAFSLFLVAEDVLLIFTNEKYLGAKMVIGILAVNVILQGLPNIFAIANMLTKNNRSYAVAIGIGAVISVAGFFILIPRLGKEGAALAMVAGNLFVPVYMSIQTQKLYHVPYNFERTIGFVIALLAFFFVAKLTGDSLGVRILSIAIIGIVLFLVYLQVFRKNYLAKKLVPVAKEAGDVVT
jgi:O-antigen/teichoic acid export membrane protein